MRLIERNEIYLLLDQSKCPFCDNESNQNTWDKFKVNENTTDIIEMAFSSYKYDIKNKRKCAFRVIDTNLLMEQDILIH